VENLCAELNLGRILKGFRNKIGAHNPTLRRLPGRTVQGVSGTTKDAAGCAGGDEWPAEG